MNMLLLEPTKKIKMSIVLLVLLAILISTYYLLNSSSNRKVTTSSQIPSYTLDLVDSDSFVSFLNDRSFFANEGLLLGDSEARTTVKSVNIVLVPETKDKLITSWNYPEGREIGLSSSWVDNNGSLALYIYIKDDSFGLQSDKNDLLLTSQILRSVLQITRQLDHIEDTNNILIDKMSQMTAKGVYWFDVSKLPQL